MQTFLEVKENENTDYQNLWDRVKAALTGELIALSACTQKLDQSQSYSAEFKTLLAEDSGSAVGERLLFPCCLDSLDLK